MKASIVALAGCGLLLGAWPAQAASPSFKGSVGPGETISVSPKPKKAGTYRLVVRDRSDEHNFRLRGAGVNVATSVGRHRHEDVHREAEAGQDVHVRL